MRFDKSLSKNFPNLANWIKREIPEIHKESRIWDPFLRFSQLSRADGLKAIAYNESSSPTIDVAVMVAYGQYRGQVRSKHLNTIHINRKLCRQFEKLDPDVRAGTNWGLVMMATILHEMVHWGDFIADGVTQPDADIDDPATGKTLKNRDVGFQFEEAAFYGIYTDKYL